MSPPCNFSAKILVTLSGYILEGNYQQLLINPFTRLHTPLAPTLLPKEGPCRCLDGPLPFLLVLVLHHPMLASARGGGSSLPLLLPPAHPAPQGVTAETREEGQPWPWRAAAGQAELPHALPLPLAPAHREGVPAEGPVSHGGASLGSPAGPRCCAS